MPPRAYNNENRLQQQEQLKARIAAAAAELHAVHGALATSYAQIAERAGVSLPTIYKHFPTLDDLTRACSGHVAAQAPPLPVDEILGAPDLAAAVERLVHGMDRINAHFAPWMAWREYHRIAALAEMADAERRQLVALCGQLLARHPGAADARETAQVWAALLDFEFWHSLVQQHKLPRAAARRRQVQLLLAAAAPSSLPQRKNRT